MDWELKDDLDLSRIDNREKAHPSIRNNHMIKGMKAWNDPA